jgi:hypothetical protein
MGSRERAIIDKIKAALGDEWAIRIIADLHLKKATVYSWDANQSLPKAFDLLKITKYLKTTVEELIEGEAGEQYLREYVQKKGWQFSPPESIADIVEAIQKLSEDELVPIRGAIKAIMNRKEGSGITPEAKSDKKTG